MAEQQHEKHLQPNEPAQEDGFTSDQPSQRDLLRRVHEMEREIDALRHKNEHPHHESHVTVSPLVLSPSSIPPHDGKYFKSLSHSYHIIFYCFC